MSGRQNYGRAELVYSGHEISINRDLICRAKGDSRKTIMQLCMSESGLETRHFPVLKLYSHQAQSSQDPKRGISSTKVVRLQPSTIQPGPQTRHFPVLKVCYSQAQTSQIPNESFPVLKLYYNQAQSSHDPKRGISSTKVVLQSSTIQPASQTRHFQYQSCTTTEHNPARTLNEVFPMLKLYYNQAQSSQYPKRGISSTRVLP